MTINTENNFINIMAAKNVTKPDNEMKTEKKTGETGFADALSKVMSDRITIDANQTLSDEQFIKQLSKKISDEVKAGASQAELEDLKRQIALGEYDIDVDDIVSKILG
jgi:anti-sigma28 factor (negative regulator of flagellin synthesis)